MQMRGGAALHSNAIPRSGHSEAGERREGEEREVKSAGRKEGEVGTVMGEKGR